jgi:hypothetical protein
VYQVNIHRMIKKMANYATGMNFDGVWFYILHQVFQPWIQKRKLAYAKHKHVISGILKHAQKQGLGRLLNNDGTPNENVIRKCDS